jgi:hypothetical protein
LGCYRIDSEEPREQGEERKHLATELVQQSKEQVQVEDIMNHQKSNIEEDEEDNPVEITWPSTGKKKEREKPTTPTTPSKQKELTLSLPHIHEGVKIMGNMLGCVNKFKYDDHDVTYMGKFLEFTQQVYMEIKRAIPSRDPIMGPKQWIPGLYNT